MSMKDQMADEKPKPNSLRRDIDENLKKVFQSALDEQVPDRFKQLLEQLKAQEGKQ